jgi:hypothetical protein
MDRKTYTIGILSLMATVMGTALLVAPSPSGGAAVGVVARDRDYSLMTAATQLGGDAIYVLDNRRGLMAVFTYDNNTQSLKIRTAEPLSNAFPQAAPGGNAPAPGGAAPRRP